MTVRGERFGKLSKGFVEPLELRTSHWPGRGIATKRHKGHSGGVRYSVAGGFPLTLTLSRGERGYFHGGRIFFGWVALGVVVGVVVGVVGDGGPADGVEVVGEVHVGVDAGQVCVEAGDVGLELVAVGDGC